MTWPAMRQPRRRRPTRRRPEALQRCRDLPSRPQRGPAAGNIASREGIAWQPWHRTDGGSAVLVLPLQVGKDHGSRAGRPAHWSEKWPRQPGPPPGLHVPCLHVRPSWMQQTRHAPTRTLSCSCRTVRSPSRLLVTTVGQFQRAAACPSCRRCSAGARCSSLATPSQGTTCHCCIAPSVLQNSSKVLCAGQGKRTQAPAE